MQVVLKDMPTRYTAETIATISTKELQEQLTLEQESLKKDCPYLFDIFGELDDYLFLHPKYIVHEYPAYYQHSLLILHIENELARRKKYYQAHSEPIAFFASLPAETALKGPTGPTQKKVASYLQTNDDRFAQIPPVALL